MGKNTVLRWVKASERLPDDGGYYFVRIGKLKDKHLLPRMQLIEKWRIYGEGGVEVEWLEESESPAALSAEEIERLSEDYAESVISEDATATYTAAQAYHHVKKAYKMALLSQRQPVAPEREEAATTIHWNGTGYVTNDGTPVRVSWATGIGEVPAENKGASGSADGLSKKGGEG